MTAVEGGVSAVLRTGDGREIPRHLRAEALIADTSLPGLRVVRELEAIIAGRGRPAMCVSDNGTELTGMAVLRW